MGKKANARDWYEQEKQAANNGEDLEEQGTLLFYAANKRGVNYPSEQTLRGLGFIEVADKVYQAYSLLQEAECLFRQQNGEQYE